MKSKIIEDPRIKVRWIRGAGLPSANINFSKPRTHIILGPIGSGKSNLLEVIATRHDKIIDLFGSRDDEGLAWFRHKGFSKNEILLVHGESVELSGTGQTDAISTRRLHLIDVEQHRIVVSVHGLFGSLDEEFQGLNHIIHGVLYKRKSWSGLPWSLNVREGANYLYSRMKVTMNQTLAKNDFVYLCREIRHMGFEVTVDTIKWTSIDLDVRHVSDHTWIKRVGIFGLPHDIRFIYRYIDPPSLMDPPAHAFVILNSRGPIGVGRVDFAYWHKLEQENLMQELGIKPEYGEMPDYGNLAKKTVGDYEHAVLMGAYLDKRSMAKLSLKYHRSPATIQKHIKEHDRNIEVSGYCPKCKRVHGIYAKRFVSKEKVKVNVVKSFKEFQKTFTS